MSSLSKLEVEAAVAKAMTGTDSIAAILGKLDTRLAAISADHRHLAEQLADLKRAADDLAAVPALRRSVLPAARGLH